MPMMGGHQKRSAQWQKPSAKQSRGVPVTLITRIEAAGPEEQDALLREAFCYICARTHGHAGHIMANKAGQSYDWRPRL
jgi:cytochrome c5